MSDPLWVELGPCRGKLPDDCVRRPIIRIERKEEEKDKLPFEERLKRLRLLAKPSGTQYDLFKDTPDAP